MIVVARVDKKGNITTHWVALLPARWTECGLPIFMYNSATTENVTCGRCLRILAQREMGTR